MEGKEFIDIPEEVMKLAQDKIKEGDLGLFLGDPDKLIELSDLEPFPMFLPKATTAYKEAMAVIRQDLPSDAVVADEVLKVIAGHVARLLELLPPAKAYITLAEDFYFPPKGQDIEIARKHKMRAKASVHQLIHDRLDSAIKAGMRQLDRGKDSNYFNSALMRHM